MARARTFHLPQLDGFRAIALIVVLIGHELLATRAHEIAAAGVLLFFVLSGYLITTLLCLEQEETGRISISSFYLRRALRILPAMYFFLAVCAILASLGLVTDVPWSSFAAAALYVRNIFGRGATLAHLWSLSLEEQFYLAWPALFVVLPRTRRFSGVMALICAAVVWRFTAISLHIAARNLGVYYERTDFRFDSILSGCALALAQRSPWANRRLNALPFLFLPAVVVAETACLFAPPWLEPFRISLETVFATGILACAISVRGFARTLSMAPLRWIGRISYSWYLWQQLFVVTKQPDWGWIRGSPVDLLASLALALVSHYLVERPFLRWKDSLMSGSRATRSSIPLAASVSNARE